MGMARKSGMAAMAAAAGLWIALPAWAHTPGMAHTGFAEGLLHPFTGADHILAMLAVGLWAAARGGRHVWLLPLTFMAVMAAGGVADALGAPLFAVEQMIVLSVLVLGLATAWAARASGAAAMALVAVFALFHGHAHGAEAAADTALLPYALGFVTATGLLHAAGIAAGWVLGRGAPWLPRLAGGAIAAAGGLLAAHLFHP